MRLRLELPGVLLLYQLTVLIIPTHEGQIVAPLDEPNEDTWHPPVHHLSNAFPTSNGNDLRSSTVNLERPILACCRLLLSILRRNNVALEIAHDYGYHVHDVRYTTRRS